jgi:hypothetical protein
VEIVRLATDAWNRGGWKAVTDAGLLDDEVEYHDDPRWPEARSTVGPAALAERFEEVLEVLGADAKAELEEVFDAGEQVVLIFRFRGQARASGIPHDYRWGYRYRFATVGSTSSRLISIPRTLSEPPGCRSSAHRIIHRRQGRTSLLPLSGRAWRVTAP